MISVVICPSCKKDFRFDMQDDCQVDGCDKKSQGKVRVGFCIVNVCLLHSQGKVKV